MDYDGALQKISTTLGICHRKLKKEEQNRVVVENRKLHELSLIKFGLTTIPTGLFDKLVELELLRLELNSIETIEMGAFRSLENLRELNLSFNEMLNYRLESLMGWKTLRY